MFILSANSLINIDAAVSEPITPNGSYVPYQSITTDLSDAKKVSILPMKVNMLVEVQFY